MPAVNVTLETWSGVVKKHLENVQLVDEEIRRPDGTSFKARRVAHASDPPATFQESWGVKRPGHLPALIDIGAVPKDAHTLKSTHNFVLDHPDVKIVDKTGAKVDTVQHQLEHLAQVVVVEARRHSSSAIALETPRVDGDVTVFPVVMVLSRLTP